MKSIHDGDATRIDLSVAPGAVSTPTITRRTMLSSAYDPSFPRVRFATFRKEDAGETIPLYLHSHEEIDAEIDQRIRLDGCSGDDHRKQREATRAKFHAVLQSQVSERGELDAA